MSETPIRDYRQLGIEAHGEECQVCGATENIIVHHRNEDRSDNRIENLLPLCSSCHGKVHNRHPAVADLVRELGNRPLPPERTSIRVSQWIADLLYERKGREEKYDDVILQLIEAEKGEEVAPPFE
jgi:hypothetical protein